MTCVLQEEILSSVDQPENSGEDMQAVTQEQLEAIQESLVMDQGQPFSAKGGQKKAFYTQLKRRG